MACAPAAGIPLLACCNQGGCPFAYWFRASRPNALYHYTDTGGVRRFFLNNYVCQAQTSGPPICGTITVNRFNYALTVPSDIQPVAGGAPDDFRVSPISPAYGRGVLSGEITRADMIADLEALLAIPIPVAGTVIDFRTLQALPNSLAAGVSPLVPIFPQFSLSGQPILSLSTAPATIQDAITGRIGGTPPLCSGWSRDYRMFNSGGPPNLYAAKMRFNLKGSYCYVERQIATPEGHLGQGTISCHSGTAGNGTDWTLVDFDVPPAPPSDDIVWERQMDHNCFCQTGNLAP